MPVSVALEKSARDFCSKYDCNFDYKTFEACIEEFTFLRPNNGWIDVYKMMFEKMYMQALESVSTVSDETLDSEAMLDDFEYTLIRPYVKESENEIKHKPYVGMDRVSRLTYLQQLTNRSPSNSVDLYAEKYKNGMLPINQIRSRLERGEGIREHSVEMAGCVLALEAVNKSRTLAWRVFHPFKNNFEKKNSAEMKKAFIESAQGGEELYAIAAAEAYETFEGYQRVNAGLEERMIHAREELNRKQKMSNAMRESIRIETLEREPVRELSPRVEQFSVPSREKQFTK